MAVEDRDFTTHLSVGTWKRFMTHALKMKRELILLAISMVLMAALESAAPLMTRYAIDHFIANGTTEGIIPYAIAFFVLVTVTAICTRFFLYYAGAIETGLNYEIRKAGFSHLQELSFSYYDRTPVGWLMSRMVSDTNRLSEVVAWGIVDIAWGLATIIAILIAMFALSVRLALIALAVIPLLAVIAYFFQKRLLRAQRKIRRLNSRITGMFNEGIMGARTSKTLRREQLNSAEFNATAAEMYEESVRTGAFGALFLPIVSFLGGIGSALVLSIGGSAVVSGVILTGTLYAFMTYMTRIWDPIRHLARILTELQSAQAAAERVMTMLSEKPDIGDRPEVIARYGEAPGEGSEPWPEIEGRVTFDNVSFSYGGEEQILANFNLDVPVGQTIALVGETGAGKSTIVNLACRFYEPTSGTIRIDGRDYRDLPLLWLYRSLGYVLQTPHLFSGTIAENIRYGNLEATQEQIENAARLVSAHDFIVRLENGYDTEVGEGGNLLSTGEKQLISFARAILANPRIFILDEATSSVDTETEQLIQRAIAVVLAGRTSFVIAHRLSTIRKADRILVIEDGRIIEEGTHSELIRRRGHYYELYLNQFISETIDETAARC
ncbi:MAG: ABC transporter ATP-binding protein [Saccharofermentanales bacterium]|jgi:ATP-binding cassette subfamily B protein